MLSRRSKVNCRQCSSLVAQVSRSVSQPSASRRISAPVATVRGGGNMLALPSLSAPLGTLAAQSSLRVSSSAFARDTEFMQLIGQVRQNPQMLAPLLEQLSQSNPQLVALIAQHQDQFHRLVNEAPVPAAPPAGGGGGGGGGEPVTIQLSQEDIEGRATAAARLLARRRAPGLPRVREERDARRQPPVRRRRRLSEWRGRGVKFVRARRALLRQQRAVTRADAPQLRARPS